MQEVEPVERHTLSVPARESTRSPAGRSPRRAIPSLDGLRAVSIALVIIAHVATDEFSGVRALGSLGVRVFFVISGFLITTLLIAEKERTGTIDLARFFLRRTLRIFPPYYFYIGVVAILLALGVGSAPNVRFLPALTYTTNWFSPRAGWLGHSWSLSVEEQFYLCWPFCIVLVGMVRARSAAIAVLLFSSAVRCLIYVLTKDGLKADGFNFDFIAAGCLLALLEPEIRDSARWRRLLQGFAFPALAIVALLLHLLFVDQIRWRFLAEMVVIQPVQAVCLALFLAWCVARPESAMGRVLNTRILRRLGVASYSIYLWQQLFVGDEVVLPWYGKVACALAAGAAGYIVVEKPVLALRKRIEPPPSSASAARNPVVGA